MLALHLALRTATKIKVINCIIWVFLTMRAPLLLTYISSHWSSLSAHHLPVSTQATSRAYQAPPQRRDANIHYGTTPNTRVTNVSSVPRYLYSNLSMGAHIGELQKSINVYLPCTSRKQWVNQPLLAWFNNLIGHGLTHIHTIISLLT